MLGRTTLCLSVCLSVCLSLSVLHVLSQPSAVRVADCGLGLDCADSFYSASFIAYHALKSQEIVGRVPVQS